MCGRVQAAVWLHSTLHPVSHRLLRRLCSSVPPVLLLLLVMLLLVMTTTTKTKTMTKTTKMTVIKNQALEAAVPAEVRHNWN